MIRTIPVLLLITLVFMISCESTELDPQFEVEDIFLSDIINIEAEPRTGFYFVFSPEKTALYTIGLYEQTCDFDLTIGLYDESDLFIDQDVLYSSKHPSLIDELLEDIELDSDVQYLIEVWNYSDNQGTTILTITENE
ncbi:MAG: hypothetical protein PF637_05150 [Spirochaetes bacterium]|jgi:hypothetical protein|nr:hypothetical protein [Spirochaetota bacterium]